MALLREMESLLHNNKHQNTAEIKRLATHDVSGFEEARREYVFVVQRHPRPRNEERLADVDGPAAVSVFVVVTVLSLLVFFIELRLSSSIEDTIWCAHKCRSNGGKVCCSIFSRGGVVRAFVLTGVW